jgi:hypothetical protein
MLSQSRPACDLAVLSPYPVLTAVLSSLWLSPTSLPRVRVANVRPAVVLFYDLPLLVLRLIFCSPLFYAGRRHPPIPLISHSPPQFLDLVCVCVLLQLPRRRVFSLVLSCSRSYRMCILLSDIDLFRCRLYFLPDLSSFLLPIFFLDFFPS